MTQTEIAPSRLEDFMTRLPPLALAPLWEVLKGLVPPEPKSKARAHFWRYPEVRELLMEAGGLLTAEEAERRVLVLENPALAGLSRISNTLYAGFQLVLPGEVAPAHKHTAQAMRFIIEGEGGHTTVAGERTFMQRGDFVVTPNGAFHDHGTDGKTPVIWLDVLDVVMVNFFEAAFSEELGDHGVQNVRLSQHASNNRWGKGMLPIRKDAPYGLASPVISYPYDRSRSALMGVSRDWDIDAHHGFQLKYANPNDGGWVMPTMATWLTHLPAGFQTKPSRSTDSQIVLVSEGSVTLKIAETEVTLEENDVAIIPSWKMRQMQVKQDTILFCASDRAAQENLGFWREELA